MMPAQTAPSHRRFQHAVPWAVVLAGGAETIHVDARSECKALRAVKRRHPRVEIVRAECMVPSASAPLSGLLVEIDYAVRIRGETWVVTRYEDDAVRVARGAHGRAVLLPPHVGKAKLCVGQAVAIGAKAANEPMVIATVAVTILHGVVLQAPVRYPLREIKVPQKHARIGAHPDGGGGYACVTDPHGVVHDRVQWAGERLGDEPDRTAFAAAERFVGLVGTAGAVWSIAEARQKVLPSGRLP